MGIETNHIHTNLKGEYNNKKDLTMAELTHTYDELDALFSIDDNDVLQGFSISQEAIYD